MARRLGWQQTRVNKLEHGYQLPSPEDLDPWVAAVDANLDVRAELGDLLTNARIQYSSWAEVYRCGAAAWVSAAADSWHCADCRVRPGVTHYSRGSVLTGATPERIEVLIAQRVKRQELLYGPGRRVQIVLGEAALTVHFEAVDTLLGQLDRPMTLAGLPSLDLRVLPRAVASGGHAAVRVLA